MDPVDIVIYRYAQLHGVPPQDFLRLVAALAEAEAEAEKADALFRLVVSRDGVLARASF